MSRAVVAVFTLCLATLGCKPPVESNLPPTTADPTPTDEFADILAASDLPPTLDTPLDGDPMGVTIHRLSNGLTVYLSTDRHKPRISAWIAVRTGSRNDPPHSTGLAHYLEHMLFKGTDELGTLDFAAEQPHLERVRELYAELRETQDPARRRAIFGELDRENQAIAKHAVPNELDRLYTTLGVDGINAFTSNDMTVYIGDLPTNRLEAWATLEAERFADPSWRLFFTEIESVYEEKNLSLDDTEERGWDLLMKQLFPAHPYGTQTTIGEIDHLKSPAFEDMVEYFQRWYVPNNMAVLLAGDVDAETALPILERSLGRWRARPLEPATPAELAPIAERMAGEVVGEGEQAVAIAWQTVPFNHPDEPVLSVLHWLLDNSTSGLFNVELELSQKVPDASAFGYHMLESGVLIARATAREGQSLDEVEGLLMAVIGKLAAGEFSQADIDAIVLANEVMRKQQAETNEGRVSKMMDSFVFRQPWTETIARDEALRRVTREDVMRVATTYLGEGRSVVHRRAGKPSVAKIDKPSISAIEVDPARKSAFARGIESIPAAELEPEWLVAGTHYTRSTLAAGPFTAVPNQRNDLFHVSYQFDRGHRREPLLCFALELLEQSGTKTLSPEALQKRLFALGSSIDLHCDADESSIEVRGIDAHMEETLALLDDWMREAEFGAETARMLAKNVISRRRDQLEDPDALWGALEEHATRDRESSYRSEPSNARIANAKLSSLARLVARFPDHAHETLYFGPRPAADAAKVLGIGKDHRPLERRAARRFREVDENTIWFVHREVAKSYISVHLADRTREREHRPIARLYNNYLNGGMNALLFQEMREARGLVYFAYGYVDQGRYPDDPWAFGGGMGTQVDKTVDALGTFLDLVRARPLDPARISIARTALDQEYRSSRIDPRWAMYWLDGWEDAGEADDPRPWYWDRIRALEDEALIDFAQGFAKLPVVVAIVGDRNRIDMQALGRLGKVVEVEPGDLFGYGAFPRQ